MHRIATHGLFFALIAGGVATLVPAPSRARPGKIASADADRLAGLAQTLTTALAGLEAKQADAVAAHREAAETALAGILDTVDRYHHAPNLRRPAARPHVLRLRPHIGRLFAADGPLVLVRDVIHPAPRVSALLAEAARLSADHPAEVRHLRQALAVRPDDAALLTALRTAHLILGDVRAAEAVAVRLARLRAGSATGISAPR